MSYDILETNGVIFTTVEDLCEIGGLTGKPYSEIQIVNLGHIVIGNHNMFRSDLRRWICCLS